MDTHSSNTIFKFADDTTVVGLITGDNETAYKEELNAPTHWCQENNLSLNVKRTKVLVVDPRIQDTPITINSTPVKRFSHLKFLSIINRAARY